MELFKRKKKNDVANMLEKWLPDNLEEATLSNLYRRI